MNKVLIFLFLLAIVFSCKEESPKPKPKAYLALNYEEPSYDTLNINCAYQFLKNKNAHVTPSKSNRNCWININYANQKAQLYITYNSIDQNLKELLVDAQKLPLEHSIKADEIEANVFEDVNKRTFGTLYEIKGDAASQAQFYLTDSINHFLTGSLYFDATPNYDSVLPAAEYIKNDLRKIMESIAWKK